jgi:tripartite-type tricarboxylate transporter receptor subunit TctC
VPCAIWTQCATAQSYPAKPIRIIVPYTAGGTTDVVARAVAVPISASVGQQILVENRPGGSSIIGMLACAKSAPDGYTLCMTVADSLSYNPHVIKDLPYDADKDFVAVINLVRSNSMLFAKANAPFGSIKEMIAYARSKPGAINWATWGSGSIPEVYLLWIKHETGADITGVAYKGSGPSTAAVLAGEVDVTFMSIGPLLPHIKSGKAKALAVVGKDRSTHLPDTPSLAEEGVDPGLRSYFGVFAPAKTPKAIVDRLNAEFAKALQAPRVQELLRSQTLDAVGGSAEEFARFLVHDRANAGRVFKAIGVRPGEAPK